MSVKDDTVWVVWDWETGILYGAFSSEEKAENYKLTHRDGCVRWVSTEKVIVDDEERN